MKPHCLKSRYWFVCLMLVSCICGGLWFYKLEQAGPAPGSTNSPSLKPLQKYAELIEPSYGRLESQSPDVEASDRQVEKPVHYILRLREGIDRSELTAVLRKKEARIRTDMREPRTFLASVPEKIEDLEFRRCVGGIAESIHEYGIRLPEGFEHAGKFVTRVHFQDPEEIEEGSSFTFLECCLSRNRNYAHALMDQDEFWLATDEGRRVEVDDAATRSLDPSLLEVSRAGQDERSSVRASARALPSDTFLGGYRTVSKLYADLKTLAIAYPGITQLVDYGDSYAKHAGGITTPGGDYLAGHDLLALKITNKSITGAKPVFFLIGNIHAREITMPELCMRFIGWLVHGYGSDADATWLVDHHEIWVIPTANPDGHWMVELGTRPPYNGSPWLWRKTANPSNGCTQWPPSSSSHFGIDGNRNFDFKWGVAGSSGSACSQTYRGPFPASEPEVERIQALVRSRIPDQRGPLDSDAAPPTATGILLQIHSHGKLVLWPWGYKSSPSPNASGLHAIGMKYASYNGYTAGQTYSTIYPASATIDEWSYGELGIASHIFEIGTTFMPSYSTIDSTQWPENRGAFIYAAKIARTPYLLANGPDALDIAAVPSGSALNVSALIDDGHNGNQSVAAAEAYVNIPPWKSGAAPLALTATDGSYNTAAEAVRGSMDLGALPAGRHLLYVRGRDAAGNWGPFSAVFFDKGVSPPPENQAPQIVSAPWADPSPASLSSGTTVNVVASDPDSGPQALTFTWSRVSGPGTVTFIANGTASASISSTSFSAAGEYLLKVSVSDGAATATANLSVSVLDTTSPPPSGELRAHWKLNDGSGTTAIDGTGGQHGTLAGGGSWTVGHISGGLAFDEIDDRVTVPDFSYAPAGVFSLAFWFNPFDNNGSAYQYIFSHGAVGTKNSVNVYMVEGSSGILRTSLVDSDDGQRHTALDVSGGMVDGQWHHYALVVTGSGSTVYIDGTARKSSSQGGGAFDPSGKLFLGCREDLNTQRFYGGILDEVRIYDKALTIAEVQALSQEVTPPPEPPVAEAAWEAVHQNAGGQWSNSEWGQRTFRILLQGAHITASGQQVRLQLRGRSSGSYTLRRVSLVRRDGATLDGLDGTFTRLTFGGTWEDGVSVSSGTKVESDVAAFDLQAGQDVFLTFWAESASVYLSGGSATTAFTIKDADHAAMIDWGGLALSETRSHVYAAEIVLAASPEDPLPDGLAASWTLDEHSGTTATDASGNGHHGTLVNGPLWVAGKNEQALSFDETDDRVTVPDFAYAPTGAFTLAFWFKVSDNNGSAYQYIFSHGAVGTKNSVNVYMVEGSSGILRTSLVDSDDAQRHTALDVSGGMVDGQWHHYALVVTGSGSTVYIDGTARKSTSQGGGAFDPSGKLFLGCREDLNAQRFYGGILDEVRIYSRALSAGEVGALAAP